MIANRATLVTWGMPYRGDKLEGFQVEGAAYAVEQVGGAHVEAGGDLHDGVERGGFPAFFYIDDVVLAEADHKAKCADAEPLLFAEHSDSFAQCL